MLPNISAFFKRLQFYWRLPGEIKSSLSSLNQRVAILEGKLEELTTIKKQLSESNRKVLEQRSVIFDNLPDAHATTDGRPANAAVARDLEADLQQMARRFPHAFPIWRQAFEAGAREYDASPSANLSVPGHPVAAMFRDFLRPYVKGRVLDVGCGPQRMPLYLAGLSVGRLAGLDPLYKGEPRDFEVVKGIAEFLPWPDAEFGCVISGTSLDHVISLDIALAEFSRVLKPDGRLLLWVGFVKGSKPYDPEDPSLSAVDQYHLFHFDRGWFLALMETKFELVEEFDIDGCSCFFAFQKPDADNKDR